MAGFDLQHVGQGTVSADGSEVQAQHGPQLVKGIVEGHGGDIAVISEEGRGTEFVVRIPEGTGADLANRMDD